MLGKARYLVRSRQLKKKLGVLHDNALIGEKFEFGTLAHLINESGDKSKIVFGHHCRLNGLIICRLTGNIEIGNYSTIQDRVTISCLKQIKIGHYVGIGDRTVLFDHDAVPQNAESRVNEIVKLVSTGEPYVNPVDIFTPTEAAPIIIGDVVWIGADCVISKGVTLGEACIIARNSVVTSDVPPYTIVAGNPAKVVKEMQKPDHPYYEV